MELIDRIKRDQTRRKAKIPFRRSPYATVIGIVNRHGLREEFAQRVGSPPDIPAGNGFIRGPLKRKHRLDPPPFALADRELYLLAGKILNAAGNNPYVAFACSPDEIILSRSLFTMNPNLPPRLLERLHFETLILAEVARSRLTALRKTVEGFSARSRAASRPAGSKTPQPPMAGIDTLHEQIRGLEEFVSFVEATGRTEEER